MRSGATYSNQLKPAYSSKSLKSEQPFDKAQILTSAPISRTRFLKNKALLQRYEEDIGEVFVKKKLGTRP